MPNNGKKLTIEQYSEKIAIRMATITALVIAFAVLASNTIIQRKYVPMLGDEFAFAVISHQVMFPVAFIIFGICFYLGIKAWNSRVPLYRERTWIMQVIPVALAYTVLYGLISEFAIQLANDAFKYLELLLLQAALVASAFGAILMYQMSKWAMSVDAISFLRTVSLTIGLGLYLTMISIDNPLWWEVSFSYLGTADSNSNQIFNFTLMLSGILIIIWAQYFSNDFYILVRKKFTSPFKAEIIEWCLKFLGICIFFVGMFPSRASTFSSIMHNSAAYSLGFLFGILMLGSKWLMPRVSKEFFTSSLVFMGILGTILIMAAFGRVNTVGLELGAFVFGIAWLSIFISYVDKEARALEPSDFPK